MCAYGRVECACMGEREGVCIWKGLGVHAWGEGGCEYGRGGVCVYGEREGVYTERVECACMERGKVCI